MTDETNTTNETAPETKPETKPSTRQMSFTVLDSGEIRAEFGPGLEALTLNPALVPESLIAAAVTEGLIARARSYGSKLEGEARTPEALRAATAKAFENMLAGIWKVERSGTGGEFPIEVEAAWVFRQKRAVKAGKDISEAGTLEQTAEAFGKLTDEQKKELKGVALYKVAYAEVKAARDAAKLAKLQKEAEAEESGPEGF